MSLIDQHIKGTGNRSEFIESAVRAYLTLMERKTRDLADLDLLNDLSDKLNREALEVLQYQAETGS